MMRYCELGEIGEFIMRGKFSKKDFVNDGVQCISSLSILGDDSIVLDSIDERVNIMQAQQLANVLYGDIVIMTKSYTREKLGRGSAWLGKQAVTGNEIAVFRHNESPRYMAYCTRHDVYIKAVMMYATFGIVNNISLNRLKRIKVPIYTIDEQEAIANYLDEMRIQCKCLSNGIILSKEQKAFYVDYLTSFKRLY